MTKYRSKEVVEAIQWDGKNAVQINELVEDAFNTGYEDRGLWAEVFDHIRQEWLEVPLRHWIVQSSTGSIRVVDPKLFNEKYEPANGGPANRLGLYEGEVQK